MNEWEPVQPAVSQVTKSCGGISQKSGGGYSSTLMPTVLELNMQKVTYGRTLSGVNVYLVLK